MSALFKNNRLHLLTKSAKISNEAQKLTKKVGKFAIGPKWWGLFAIQAFWPWYDVQNTSRGCIFIQRYSHENISKIHEKIFCWMFGIFFKFHSFLLIFSLLNYVQKWLKRWLNKTMFKWVCSSEDDKVLTNYEKYFRQSHISYTLVNTCWLNPP